MSAFGSEAGRGAGSCSHKTIWQLCVSLGEGLWKLWGYRATLPGPPPAISSRLQWAARGNYIWGQVFVALRSGSPWDWAVTLTCWGTQVPDALVKHGGHTDSSWPGTLGLRWPCPALTKCSLEPGASPILTHTTTLQGILRPREAPWPAADN